MIDKTIMFHLLFYDIFQYLYVVALLFICDCLLSQSLFKLLDSSLVNLSLCDFCRRRTTTHSSQISSQLVLLILPDLRRRLKNLIRGVGPFLLPRWRNSGMSRRDISTFQSYGVLRIFGFLTPIRNHTLWHICILTVCLNTFCFN